MGNNKHVYACHKVTVMLFVGKTELNVDCMVKRRGFMKRLQGWKGGFANMKEAGYPF